MSQSVINDCFDSVAGGVGGQDGEACHTVFIISAVIVITVRSRRWNTCDFSVGLNISEKDGWVEAMARPAVGGQGLVGIWSIAEIESGKTVGTEDKMKEDSGVPISVACIRNDRFDVIRLAGDNADRLIEIIGPAVQFKVGVRCCNGGVSSQGISVTVVSVVGSIGQAAAVTNVTVEAHRSGIDPVDRC